MKFDLTSALPRIRPGRPLIVTDADGVLLCFTGGFERWLSERGLSLDLTSYRLEGAIRRSDDGSRLLEVETRALVEEYREDLDHLDAVEGACEALSELAQHASIVVLSNVNHTQAIARMRNFKTLGIGYPLIANDSGGGYLADKGKAVKALAAHARAKTFFIDDIPVNLAAVAKDAPDVTLIHLVESEPLRSLLGNDFHADCYASGWREAKDFILQELLSGSPRTN